MASPRKRVTLAQPSLPHRAGKAYARIGPLLEGTTQSIWVDAAVLGPGRDPGTHRVMSILSEVRPDIDPKRIARILLDAAIEEQRQKRLKMETAEPDQNAA